MHLRVIRMNGFNLIKKTWNVKTHKTNGKKGEICIYQINFRQLEFKRKKFDIFAKLELENFHEFRLAKTD